MSNQEWSLIRPKSLNDVYGYPQVKKLLFKYIKEDKFPNAVIFQGASGIGKTTLAKLLAKYIVSPVSKDGELDQTNKECMAVDSENYDASVFRVNGGTEGSVDLFKDGSPLVDFINSPWLGRRVVLIEEFQGLSSNAKEALLLALENPASEVHYICTTTGVSGVKEKKVFETLASRAVVFNLPSPSPTDVMLFLKDFLERINKWEEFPKDFKLEGLKYIAVNFQNYRRALKELQKCYESGAFTPDAYKTLIKSNDDEENVFNMVKDVLMKRKTQVVLDYVTNLTNDQVQTHARLFKKYLADCEFYKLFNTVPDNNYYQKQNCESILRSSNSLTYCKENIYKILNYDSGKPDMVLFICGALSSGEPVKPTQTVQVPEQPIEQPTPTRRRLLD